SRALEHPGGEVEPGDDAALPLRRQAEVAGAAARVEHAVAGTPHRLHGQPPPGAVEAGGHDAVHLVVDRRNPVEHAPDVVGGEGSGLVGHLRTRGGRRACDTVLRTQSPQRLTSVFSTPRWSRQRETTKSTRSCTVSAPW